MANISMAACQNIQFKGNSQCFWLATLFILSKSKKKKVMSCLVTNLYPLSRLTTECLRSVAYIRIRHRKCKQNNHVKWRLWSSHIHSPDNGTKKKYRLTATCWPRRWMSLRTMGPGSKHSAPCLPLWPPRAAPGCRGDGGPSGTSGWNLGPSFSEKGGKWRSERSNQKVGQSRKRQKTMNGEDGSICTEQNVTLAAHCFCTSVTTSTKLTVSQRETQEQHPSHGGCQQRGTCLE